MAAVVTGVVFGVVCSGCEATIGVSVATTASFVLGVTGVGVSATIDASVTGVVVVTVSAACSSAPPTADSFCSAGSLTGVTKTTGCVGDAITFSESVTSTSMGCDAIVCGSLVGSAGASRVTPSSGGKIWTRPSVEAVISATVAFSNAVLANAACFRFDNLVSVFFLQKKCLKNMNK